MRYIHDFYEYFHRFRLNIQNQQGTWNKERKAVLLSI